MSFLYGSTDLTSKEWAITSLVSQGHTNAQIAAEIELSEAVVKNELRTIFDKTGCWNRTEVALWYLKIGVQKERRFYDRREAEQKTSDEHRKVGRRHLPNRSPRANEQHEMNLDE
jgi:DNA-binding CsgD family transcriptional regulator